MDADPPGARPSPLPLHEPHVRGHHGVRAAVPARILGSPVAFGATRPPGGAVSFFSFPRPRLGHSRSRTEGRMCLGVSPRPDDGRRRRRQRRQQTEGTGPGAPCVAPTLPNLQLSALRLNTTPPSLGLPQVPPGHRQYLRTERQRGGGEARATAYPRGPRGPRLTERSEGPAPV